MAKHDKTSAHPLPLWQRPVVMRLIAAALFITVGLIIYWPALAGGFIWDDYTLLAENPLIAAGDGLYRLWFSTQTVDYWPVTYSSFWLEWRLWGRDPIGYHVTNVLMHAAGALLLWAVLSKLVRQANEGKQSPNTWALLLPGVIWLVHPVNVESVAWIAQRKNLMAMLFFLLSILFYLQSQDQTERRARCTRYLLSIAAFLLAMLSKGSVLVLPLILPLLLWWQGKLRRRVLWEMLPYVVIAVALGAVNVWFQTHGADVSIREADLAQRLAGAGAVVWFYLYKALLPIHLSFIYPKWDVQPADWRWWLATAAAIAVTAALWWQRRSRWGKTLLAGWGYFCIALIPVMGLTDVYFFKFSLVADHYQHLALIGVCVVAAAGWNLWHKRTPRMAIIAAAVVIALLASLTWRQSRLYQDETVLYADTVTKNPGSDMAHYNLGVALCERGRYDEAIAPLQEALHLNPQYWAAENNLGLALTNAGRPADAIAHYEQALQHHPDNAKYHMNLGVALAQLKRWDEAIAQHRQATRLQDDFAEAWANMAVAYGMLGRTHEAADCYFRAMQLAKAQHNESVVRFLNKWFPQAATLPRP